MNKVKSFAVFLFAVSIIMIISGTVSTFIVSLKQDQELTQARMIVVNDTFEEFNAGVSAFELERDSLYTEALGNLYYDTLMNEDVNLKNKLNNYEGIVDEIITKVGEMDNLCKDVYYPDSEVNNKCKNYKIIYEQVANYFVDDLKLYNSTISEFNTQQTSLGSNVVLGEYKTTKSYVDYNNDGVFEGKEVDSNESV